MPDLPDRVQITFSPRLTRRIGRALPHRGQIRLGETLRKGPAKALREVLCHELAHIAVYLRYGRRPKPHGREWRGLVQQAGQIPRVSLPMVSAARSRVAKPVFVHSCPICQATRRAHRPMRRWRCATCVSHGLDGTLEIEREPT